MLNICFGADERTLLRFGLPDEQSTYSFEGLDCGRIHPDNFEQARKEWIYNAYALCSEEEKEQMVKEAFQRHAYILKIAALNKEIRIWYASNPESMCGFFHLVHSLKDIDCKIYVVEMPSHIGCLPKHHDRSWSETEPDDIQPCLKYQRLISALERETYEFIWNLLANENAELRVNINGRITSVPADYLDNEILSYAPINVEFRFGDLVGLAMQSPHYMFPTFIAKRIEAMILNKKITLVKRSDDPEYNDSRTIIRVTQP
jgi:hypothetical protein